MANTGKNPWDVRSPLDKWLLIDVLHTNDDWSLALGKWFDSSYGWCPTLAIRWNGEDGGLGTPSARGYATWFIVPTEVHELLLTGGLVPAEKLPMIRSILAQGGSREAA